MGNRYGELTIFSTKHGEKLAKNIASYLDAPYIEIYCKDFADGEPDMEINKNFRGADAFYVCPFYPEPKERWSEIQLAGSILKYSSANRKTAVASYLGFMKKDWKDRPRVPISVREIAVSMENYFDRVMTEEMHSQQIQGMFRMPLDHLDGSIVFVRPILKDYGKDVVVASPDIGGIKRAKRLADKAGIKDIATVYKTRDVYTGEVRAVEILGDVNGRDVIIVDDQLVSGGTLIEAGNKLKEKGANSVSACVVHPLLVNNAAEKLSNTGLEKIYVSDTIDLNDAFFQKYPKFRNVSSVKLLGEAIRRTHNDESISQLFLVNDEDYY